MMQLFFIGILLAAGLFFILADALKLPAMGAARAMLSAGKGSKKAAKTVETWLMSGAVKLSKYIRMDEYKQSRMTNILKAAGISMMPEVYSAYAIVKAGAILLLATVPVSSSPAFSGDHHSRNPDLLQGNEKSRRTASGKAGADRGGTAPVCRHD